MTLTQLLLAAAIAYDYSDQDKADMRAAVLADKEGMTTALRADPWLPWVAYENGLTKDLPNATKGETTWPASIRSS